MLYVDGMNAVIEQNEVVQWLYSLIESSVSKSREINHELFFVFLSFDWSLKQV